MVYFTNIVATMKNPAEIATCQRSSVRWRRVFGADSGIIGKSINLSGRSRTVIGVLPPAFFFPTASDVEIYTPLDLTPQLRDVNRARKFHFLGAVGRLRPNVTEVAASADLVAIARQLEREYPEANTGITVSMLGAREAVVGDEAVFVLVPDGTRVRDAIRPNHGSQPEQEG